MFFCADQPSYEAKRERGDLTEASADLDLVQQLDQEDTFCAD